MQLGPWLIHLRCLSVQVFRAKNRALTLYRIQINSRVVCILLQVGSGSDSTEDLIMDAIVVALRLEVECRRWFLSY